MSVTPNEHSIETVSRKSHSHEDIKTISQPKSYSSVNSKSYHSETAPNSGASSKSSNSSQRKLSSKVFSGKNDLVSQAQSDAVKGHLASLMSSSGSRSRNERVEYSYPEGKRTNGGERTSKGSISDKSFLELENGQKRVDDWKKYGLSSDDMRKKLFSSFKSKGVLNGAKIQIRADLASAINEKQTLKAPRKSKIISFASKISDCIVAQHLKKSEYEYTLSVFKAESLLSEFDFHLHEILDIMKLPPDSKIYQNLTKKLSQKRGNSFLWSFLSEMVSGEVAAKTSTECQTEEHRPLTSREIDMKMLEIEKDVMAKGRSDMEGSLVLEERLFELQRKMEAKKTKELNIEMQQFKDGLLKKVRLEEQEKSNAEFDKQKIELEKLYKERFENLMEKEKQMEVIISQKRKQIEEDAYNQRQNLLDEFTKFKDREADLQRQHELAMKSVETEESRLRTLAEELKLKDMTQKTMEERYEIKFQEAVYKLKSEQQQEQQKVEEFYKQQEFRLNEEKTLFQSEKVSLMRYQKEFEALQYKNNELQESLHSSQQRVYAMSQKIEDMKEKMQEMVDYPKLKEKILLKDREIDYLKGTLHEVKSDKSSSDAQHRKDIKDMIEKLLRGTPDTAKLQQQMLLERDGYLEKENTLKLRCKEVTKRLQEERLKNEEIMHMYEECLLQNKSLKREVQDLKKTGRDISWSGNLHNKSLRPVEHKKIKSAYNYIPFASKNFSDEHDKNHAIEIHKTVPIPQATSMDKTTISNDALAQDEKAQASREFATFERLEREAENLERMYDDFKASQSNRFVRDSDFEKPNTNDFKPLQKYESTLKQDFSKVYLEAEKDFAFEAHSEKYHRKDSSLKFPGYSSKLNRVGSEGYFREYKDSTVNITNKYQGVGSLDDNHLTEQILKTASNESSNVSTKLDLDSKSDMLNDMNRFDKVNIQRANEATNQSQGIEASNENTHLVKEGWEENGSSLSIKNNVDSGKMLDDGFCSIEAWRVNEGIEKGFEQIGDINDSTRGHTNNLENESNKELPGFAEEGNVVGTSVGGDNNDECFDEEYERRKISFTARNSATEQSEKRNENVESRSMGEDADHGMITNENEDNSLKSGEHKEKSQGNGKDDDIDPLMKHYMEMVMKKKTLTEKESEKEQLNLTDDTKIESRLSRSDNSDLIEDNIEEIQIDSGDEFDW